MTKRDCILCSGLFLILALVVYLAWHESAPAVLKISNDQAGEFIYEVSLWDQKTGVTHTDQLRGLHAATTDFGVLNLYRHGKLMVAYAPGSWKKFERIAFGETDKPEAPERSGKATH